MRDTQLDLARNVPTITHRSQRYYSVSGTATNATRALTNARNWYLPFVVPAFQTYDRIAFEVTAFGVAATIRTGIYTDKLGVPFGLQLDAGALAVAANTGFETVINKLLAPGLYWLIAVQQGATGDATLKATGGQTVQPFVGGTSITDMTQGNASGYTTSAGTGDAGALSDPAILTGLTPSAAIPVVALRAA